MTLPVMPSGCTNRPKAKERFVRWFDPEFAPCACRGRRHKQTGIDCIEVHQRVLLQRIGKHLALYTIARLCAYCNAAWMTAPELVVLDGHGGYGVSGEGVLEQQIFNDWHYRKQGWRHA